MSLLMGGAMRAADPQIDPLVPSVCPPGADENIHPASHSGHEG